MTPVRVDQELEQFLFALVDQESIPADELQLLAMLNAVGCSLDRTHLRAVIAFATACKYLERAGPQLVFTQTARKRVDALRARQDYQAPVIGSEL